MLRFSGPDGCLYRLGDPLPFTSRLEDCGDGFDWRVGTPILSFWTDGPVAVWSGVEVLEPLEIWRASGRVSLDRCHRGEFPLVEATCRPLTFVAETGGWEGELHTVVKRPNTLGQARVEASPGPRVCRFPDVTVTGRVLARLRGWEPDYLFVGVGDTINPTGSGTVLTFDEKGIVYVPA